MFSEHLQRRFFHGNGDVATNRLNVGMTVDFARRPCWVSIVIDEQKNTKSNNFRMQLIIMFIDMPRWRAIMNQKNIVC